MYKPFLIEFDFDYFCQGTETARGNTALVNAFSYGEAVDVLRRNLPKVTRLAYPTNARNFQNLTLTASL